MAEKHGEWIANLLFKDGFEVYLRLMDSLIDMGYMIHTIDVE